MVRDTLGPRHHQMHKIGISKKYSHSQIIADRLVYVGGFLGILLTIPQITTIWIEKTASGVSAISWSAYLLVAIFWIYYGIVHKERPIIITNIIWIFLDMLIIIGTILYG